MSSLNIATLPRISPQALAALVKSPASAANSNASSDLSLTANANITANPKLAIIDVRDSDYIGGHVRGSMHYPSSTLEAHLPELVRLLADKDVVVFHCMLSQQRGPGAALRYARLRESMVGGRDKTPTQQVMVLERGFEGWQQEYGRDETLTEGWRKEIWEDDD